MNELERILEIAEAEVGYLEKRTNSNLDDKTANAGYNNFTKYARDLDNIPDFYNGKKNGYAYCDIFVDWCFVKAVGKDRALELLCQPKYSCGAGCYYSLQYYKSKGQFYKSPKRGDQIFFMNSSGDTQHTGLVYAVDNNYVYTIEGNTSGASGVIANGGGVAKKKYSLNYSLIEGYGRPNYKGTDIKTNNTYTHNQFIKDVQFAIGAAVDGIVGNETISKTVTISKYKNRYHPVVKVVQKYLLSIGYSLPKYGADGDFGDETTKAVKEYQKNNGCIVDGEITAKCKTWLKLLGR